MRNIKFHSRNPGEPTKRDGAHLPEMDWSEPGEQVGRVEVGAGTKYRSTVERMEISIREIHYMEKWGNGRAKGR